LHRVWSGYTIFVYNAAFEKSRLQEMSDAFPEHKAAVGHGGAAMEAFSEMMKSESTPERRAELYQALLDYCELDTLAMVRVVEYVKQEES
jgi:hypothetical protein